MAYTTNKLQMADSCLTCPMRQAGFFCVFPQFIAVTGRQLLSIIISGRRGAVSGRTNSSWPVRSLSRTSQAVNGLSRRQDLDFAIK